MTQFWKAALLVCLSALALGLNSARAQSATLEELAGRLLGYGFDEPELIVGKLPTGLPLELPLPGGARVVGAAINGGESFEVVMDVRDTPEGILGFYTGALTGFENRGATMGSRGGFTGGNDFVYARDGLYCRDRLSVSVIVYRLDAAIKDVRVRINRYDCDFNPKSSLVLPTLTPPAGAQLRSLSSGYGGDILSGITLETSMTPADLYAHYAKQLQAAGWTALETVTLKVGVVGSFEVRDAAGQVSQALLLVTPRSGGLMDASLRVLR